MKRTPQTRLFILSFVIAIIFVSSFFLLNTKQSAAQATCQDTTYTCNGKGNGIDIFQADAEASALNGCQSSLTNCQRAKSAECARFCMRQRCITSTSVRTINPCSTPSCASGSIECNFGVNWPPSWNANNPSGRRCGITIGGGIRVNGYVCSSTGLSTVDCNCIEQSRRLE